MPSGMMQRYQGKVGVGSLYAGGLGATKGGIFVRYTNGQITPRDLNSLVGNTALSTDTITGSVPNVGITALSSSSGTRSLAAPFQGAVVTIYADLASTLALRKIYSGSSLITFDGTNTVLTSSNAGNVSLFGLSTTRWLITGNTGTMSLGTTT